MEAFPDDATMQAIAAENHLAGTAFLVRQVGDAGGDYHLRWFTPTVEVPLCGHATLASAAVVMERLEPSRTSVVLRSASGPLSARRVGPRYVLDPAAKLSPIHGFDALTDALGAKPLDVVADAFNYLVVFDDGEVVRSLAPDFAPALGIDEDPVTGSAHCLLAPYWSPRLGMTSLHARTRHRPWRRDGLSRDGRPGRVRGGCVFYL